MTVNNLSFPTYPVQHDMWDELKEEKRPLVVYGMGNGADKLIDRLDKYGLSVSDFFASDGFVRGQIFHGKRVKSFAEIKEEYSDFVILLSFASPRSEVLSLIRELDSKYDMYIPDMPVADPEYFDKEFYNTHYEEIVRAYSCLADDLSRTTYLAVINYKLTGKLKYLDLAFSTGDEIYSLINKKEIRCVIDAGAYNGDTAREAIEYFPSVENIYAIEPDPKTFKRLLRFAEGEPKVHAINAAVFSDSGSATFKSSGNRNSSISSTSSYEVKGVGVPLISIDSMKLAPNYIKYDVEGAEYEALLGAEKTVEKHRPAQLVSLYHKSRDIFFLVNYIAERYPFYKMYLRRTECVPAWEINLILVSDNEREKGLANE